MRRKVRVSGLTERKQEDSTSLCREKTPSKPGPHLTQHRCVGFLGSPASALKAGLHSVSAWGLGEGGTLRALCSSGQGQAWGPAARGAPGNPDGKRCPSLPTHVGAAGREPAALGAFLPWWGQSKEGARDTGPDHQQRLPRQRTHCGWGRAFIRFVRSKSLL